MYRTGHQGAAFLFAAPLALVIGLFGDPVALGLGAVVVSGLASAPDLDLRMPFIKHRGITHTVWAALAVGIVGAVGGAILGLYLGSIVVALVYSVLFGLLAAVTVLSHIAADALTPMGVKPFEPVSSKKYTWSFVRAANPIANYALAGIGAVVCGGAAFAGLWLHATVSNLL
ncbi:metal-dependent hydrolase [Haloferax namakaokahaiae]|uniref:Metal-dependent hydrolase n=1 Tax=Haloferax namakaokahaiae TaxID=1748331 RepID=A0ABD5ZCF3_9EURY